MCPLNFFFRVCIKGVKSGKKHAKTEKLKLLIKDNIFGVVEEIWKQNQVTVIGLQFSTNVIQINKNELMPSTKF